MCEAPARRRFLIRTSACAVVASGLGVLSARTARAATATEIPTAGASASGALAERWLALVNTHTSETLQLRYRDARGLVAGALERLNWLLRDHRANEAAPIDPVLFDALTDLAAAAGREPRYEVISAYRSPTTNAKLAAQGRGVAQRSLHMQGRAIDVRLRGFETAALRDLALRASIGGVGYYARSDFVHLDTGRLRSWSG